MSLNKYEASSEALTCIAARNNMHPSEIRFVMGTITCVRAIASRHCLVKWIEPVLSQSLAQSHDLWQHVMMAVEMLEQLMYLMLNSPRAFSTQ